MIVSKQLLSLFLGELQNISIPKIISSFFRCGVDVERWEEIVLPTNLFYGQVVDLKKVEGSNKLHLCDVFIPKKSKNFSIICGAENVKKDLKVLVALPGAKLFGGEVEIKERKVFGNLSEGMICAYSELYQSKMLSKSKDGNPGIIELPDSWDISKDFSPSDLGIEDVIFDLSIPSNRLDLHSAWGLAQELSKWLELPFPLEFSENLLQDLSDRENLWKVKKILLTNNVVCSSDYLKNLSLFLDLAFGADKEENCFSNLANSFLSSLDIPARRAVSEREIQKISLDWDWIQSFLNIPLNVNLLKKFFSKYGFEFGTDYLIPPLWRRDISNQQDFSEEVARYFDLSQIPEEPISDSCELSDNGFFLSLEKTRDFWRNKNFFECSTFNLQHHRKSAISVSNFASQEHVSYREHALLELLVILHKNYHYKNNLRPIFEIVEIHNFEGSQYLLNILVPEDKFSFPLNETKVSNDLFDLQSCISRNLSFFNQKISFISHPNPEDSLFYPTNFLQILDDKNQSIGYLGYLKSNLPINIWGGIVKLNYKEAQEFDIPLYSVNPSSFKDISIEIPPSLLLGQVLDSLQSPFLKEKRVVEKYVSAEVTSFLVRLKFQSDSKTLTKEDISKELEIINSQLRKLDVKVR